MDLPPPHLHYGVTLALPVTSFATLMFLVTLCIPEGVQAAAAALPSMGCRCAT